MRIALCKILLRASLSTVVQSLHLSAPSCFGARDPRIFFEKVPCEESPIHAEYECVGLGMAQKAVVLHKSAKFALSIYLIPPSLQAAMYSE